MRCHPHRRRAYTLVELTVSMGVATVLMGGLASAMLLASRAIPTHDGPMGAAVDGYQVLEQISTELAYAVSISTLLPTAVKFTVADRDGDGSPETIGYAWDGVAGDPLTRKFNDNLPVDFVPDVHVFELAYNVKTIDMQQRVTRAVVALQAGADPAPELRTAVQTLNLPEVP